MNLLLLRPEELAGGHARLSGRRREHVLAVHRAQVGDSLRVGVLDGLTGEGIITALDDEVLALDVRLDTPPPPRAPLILLLALPRPKMLKRILQMVATFGVEELVLLNSYRVEKSFWDSPWLAPEAIAEQLWLGLEQARDTVMPRVTLAPRFKPYVEDVLPGLLAGRRGFVAHPLPGALVCPTDVAGPTLLAIGPEGGFIPYEVDKLVAAGCQAVGLGTRILRVETAVATALGRLLPC